MSDEVDPRDDAVVEHLAAALCNRTPVTNCLTPRECGKIVRYRSLVTPGHPSTDEPAASGIRPSVNVREEAMRNEAMEQLDVLVGSWQTTMRNAWFLEPADKEVPGSATVEWLSEAFVVFRWTMEGDVGKATSEMVLAIGRSDAHDAYTALYHDERGVCRVFAMTFDGSQWNMTREDPDMFQRFIADIGPDRIAGRWEASEDHGSTWRKDFDLCFERA